MAIIRAVFAVFRRRFRSFGFFAEELSVTQAQNALIDTDGVGADFELFPAGFLLFRQQLFGIDDDLALAAEVGRHHFFQHAFDAAGLIGILDRPAQDIRGADRTVGLWPTPISNAELHNQIIAGLHAERCQIQCRGITPPFCRALAVQRPADAFELDVLAAALCELYFHGRVGQAVIVFRLQLQRPRALSRRNQTQAAIGQTDAPLRRPIGNGIQPLPGFGLGLPVNDDPVHIRGGHDGIRCPYIA